MFCLLGQLTIDRNSRHLWLHGCSHVGLNPWEGTLRASLSPSPRTAHDVMTSELVRKASSTHHAHDLSFPSAPPTGSPGADPWGLPQATGITYFRSSQPRRPGDTWSRRGRRWLRCPPRHSGAGKTPPGMGQPNTGVSCASEKHRAQSLAQLHPQNLISAQKMLVGVRALTGGGKKMSSTSHYDF